MSKFSMSNRQLKNGEMLKWTSKRHFQQRKFFKSREFKIASCGKYSKTRLKTLQWRIMGRQIWKTCIMELEKLLLNLYTIARRASIWTMLTLACGERQTISHSRVSTRIVMLQSIPMEKDKCLWQTWLSATPLLCSLMIHWEILLFKVQHKFATTVWKETLEIPTWSCCIQIKKPILNT